MKKGLILLNAEYQSKQFDEQASRLVFEFKKLGVQMSILRNDILPVHIDGKVISKLSGYDFIIYLDKDKYISQMLTRAGHKLFNRSIAIEICDDKMLTHISLAGSGIPMPKTIASPLVYNSGKMPTSVLSSIASELGYPLVAKRPQSSLGAEVYKIGSAEQLSEIASCGQLIFQQYIESGGEDYRIMVVGGRVVSCIKRTGVGGFVSNIACGGSGQSVTPPSKMIGYALMAVAVLGLDYAGLDFLVDSSGNIYLCEVNSNALMLESERISGVNIAGAYASYICSKLQ